MISITAVVPTFDRPDLLVKAVASILRQSSPADEVIIVDNGTVPVPIGLLPSGVQLLRIAPRAGVSAARNAGASAARSDYVAFLDDDDRWDDRYLEEIRSAMDRHDESADVILARKDREVDGLVAPYKEIISLTGLRDLLMVKNPGIGGQNVVVRREFFATIKGFRSALHGPEDRALLVDAIDHDAVIVLAPCAIAVKVIHPGEQITDGARSLQSTWRYLRFYWSSMSTWQRRRNLRRLARALCYSAGRRLGPSSSRK